MFDLVEVAGRYPEVASEVGLGQRPVLAQSAQPCPGEDLAHPVSLPIGRNGPGKRTPPMSEFVFAIFAKHRGKVCRNQLVGSLDLR
ncbi:hypothetical protein Nans01_31000 [Nocardiopsis ansamitocini]|uniref:Uncharacterized protein n=1 Tax=Nocardiopsis ansamitocini TaxID=1670832 RepID=A0A9W6P776_9ACTN|nr:hypothetical protein Nans01_31000 [Nocardiopsis ansamitocini]